jgi:hypothetical protein
MPTLAGWAVMSLVTGESFTDGRWVGAAAQPVRRVRSGMILYGIVTRFKITAP